MKVFEKNIFMVFLFYGGNYMKNSKTYKITLSALFLALGIVMPFFTAQIPSIGSQLLPMHIPVLLCGFVLGGPYGAIIGFITPLLRSALFSMPPMFPTAICMAFELAVYGFMSGYLYRHLQKTTMNVYLSLITAMICGRVVWGIVSVILFSMQNQAFSLSMFIAGAFANAMIGIVLQIIIIPLCIMALERAHLIYE